MTDQRIAELQKQWRLGPSFYPVSLNGHTIDLLDLPESPLVLDVGCRHFDFTQGILCIRPRALVTALDPDPTIEDPHVDRVRFHHAALTGKGDSKRDYCMFSTGEGNFVGRNPAPESKVIRVRCYQIQNLSVNQWDIVKLDCEGSEFEILEQWPGPIAKQISVEFHDFQDQEKYNNDYFWLLFSRMAEMGYVVLQHPYYKIGEAMGHWDTVFRLRS